MKLPDKSMPPLTISPKQRRVAEKQKVEAFKKFAVKQQMSDEEIDQRRELLRHQADELKKGKRCT